MTQEQFVYEQSQLQEWFTLCLSVAVPMWISQVKEKGRGVPTESDFVAAHQSAAEVLFKSDIILRKCGEPGVLADLFNQLAFALAVMAFEPEGVEVFGIFWKV